MPSNGLNFGIDAKITFTDGSGVQQFALLESFTSAEVANVTPRVQMNGVTLFPKLDRHWRGTFVFQRNSNVIDNYIAVQEAVFYAGGDQVPGTIHETITEISGAISQYIYTNVVLTLEDAGMWSGTDIVKQTFSFVASRRQIVS